MSEFLSPFEEFAHLERLRNCGGARIPTKAPLAIYSPVTHHLDWQLGRSTHCRCGRKLWALVDYALLVPYPASNAQGLQAQQNPCDSTRSRQGTAP